MDKIIVTPLDEQIEISADTDSRKITITDLVEPNKVTVLNTDPIKVIPTEDTIKVNVGAGAGGWSFDADSLANILSGKMDMSKFSIDIQDDLLLMRDLWSRVGRDVEQVLLDSDRDSIQETAITYTDTQIATAAIDIRRIDDTVQANVSAIDQNASSISLRVDELVTTNTEEFTHLGSRLDITASEISTQVSRLDATDSEVTQSQSEISQLSDRITTEVSERIALADGVVTENTSRITQTASALLTAVQSTEELTGIVNSSVERLTANEKIISVLSEGLAEGGYTLQTIMELTANSYGVVIEETVGGTPYVAGFELMLHPLWVIDYPYVVSDTVSYSSTGSATDGKTYKCLADHTSDIINSPSGLDKDIYWEEVSLAKTEFNVKADNFSVITPTGTTPLFTVDGVTGATSINGDLVVQTIKSIDYDEGDPSKSWFSLDPTTGLAVFNNISMTFGSDADRAIFQDSVGIINNSLLTWEGVKAIKTNAYLGIADEWVFDSSVSGGVLIEIEVDDAFVGELQIALNEQILTVDLFGDRDFGDVSSSVGSGFSDESDIDNYRDLSIGGKSYDLGGFS